MPSKRTSSRIKQPAEHSPTHNRQSDKSRHIPHRIRQLVWNTHAGEDKGTTMCHCCYHTKISQLQFECGHIQARAKGGPDSVDNLKPICGACNRSMGTMNMLEFQHFHKLSAVRPWRSLFPIPVYRYLFCFAVLATFSAGIVTYPTMHSHQNYFPIDFSKLF